MLRVEGFAAPYREPNSYGETFAARAFAGKLHPLDAGVMHEGPVGFWDDVWEDEAGIWVRGRILHPHVIRHIDLFKTDFPELSVSWLCANHIKARELRQGERFGEWAPCIVGPNDTSGLAEVSFVDSGSFQGTHWRIIA